ncbi:MAG: ABC transporter substrate-binding protein [Steroidobacteraceae bacterium]
MGRVRWRGGGMLLAIVLFVAQAHAEIGAGSAGELIFRHGTLPSAQPVIAERAPDSRISGAEAACSNCHGRSGFGKTEGRITIPPIHGSALVPPRARNQDARGPREPYTDASLARAIREGLSVDGTALNYLMPRYALTDIDLAALIEYLKSLTPEKVRGLAGMELHLATITTPDADPVKLAAVLNVLRQYVADQNASALAERPRMDAAGQRISKVNRRWRLHVWNLSGSPEGWGDQLRRHLAEEPVFAVLSGLGGNNWAPVHRFCEQSSLPCLFPNVDLPVVMEHDFYPLYFSRGVLLEAALIAQQLAGDQHTAAPRRIVQVFRTGDVGEPAAIALNAALAGSGLQISARALSSAAGERQLAGVLEHVGPREALVLWLRPADIAQLSKLPVRAHSVFISGLMGGLGESPVPAAWRPMTHMTYPFDLPERRVVPVDYALGWFALRHIPVVAEQVQVDTYLACSVLAETLSLMGDSLTPEYLIERIEGMLEQRLVSGFYPRLSLGPNERFASKGGYMVHFASPTGAQVLPDTDWLIP